MYIKKTKEELLDLIRASIKSIVPDTTVILFGSRVRGDENPDSDWDFLVILDKPRIESSDYDDISYKMYELGWEEEERNAVISLQLQKAFNKL